MDVRDSLRRVSAAARRFLAQPETRTLLPIFLIAMAGPVGEALDVAFFLSFEAEALAFDLGLEVVSSILVYGYRLIFILISAMGFAAFCMMSAREGWAPVHALASCRSSRPAKVPIR